jgi:hypothetical protein
VTSSAHRTRSQLVLQSAETTGTHLQLLVFLYPAIFVSPACSAFLQFMPLPPDATTQSPPQLRIWCLHEHMRERERERRWLERREGRQTALPGGLAPRLQRERDVTHTYETTAAAIVAVARAASARPNVCCKRSKVQHRQHRLTLIPADAPRPGLPEGTATNALPHQVLSEGDAASTNSTCLRITQSLCVCVCVCDWKIS